MREPSQRASELASYEAPAMVPIGYAEKSMASLMQLHTELMDEKERRVDLYRRLMDKEQALAELKMYVRLLEDKLARQSDEGWSANSGAVRAEPFNPASIRSPGACAKPPQPPGPARERVRFVVKPRAANGRSEPQSNGGAAFRATHAARSGDAPSEPSEARAERSAVDGWRAW